MIIVSFWKGHAKDSVVAEADKNWKFYPQFKCKKNLNIFNSPPENYLIPLLMSFILLILTWRRIFD